MKLKKHEKIWSYQKFYLSLQRQTINNKSNLKQSTTMMTGFLVTFATYQFTDGLLFTENKHCEDLKSTSDCFLNYVADIKRQTEESSWHINDNATKFEATSLNGDVYQVKIEAIL